MRVLTYTGTATIFFGLLLIPRTRGYDNLLGGKWGGIIVSCIVIAVALIGFGLSVFAVGLMTRALYAPT